MHLTAQAIPVPVAVQHLSRFNFLAFGAEGENYADVTWNPSMTGGGLNRSILLTALT
jgi:hypothetical protein